MTRLKGPRFPSWDNDGAKIKKILVWQPGYASTRQRLRNMRALAREIIDSTDPVVISVGVRVIKACADEPNPEFTSLHLICAGITMSREENQPWINCMTYIMNEYEQRSTLSAQIEMNDQLSGQLQRAVQHTKELDDAQTAEGNSNRSFFRRLLRAVTPRALRARDERRAATSEHQRTRDVDGERATGERRDPPEDD